MNTDDRADDTDRAPGSHRSNRERLRSYTLGLGLAAVLTATG